VTGGKFPIRDTDIQERQAQQHRGLSWGGYIICNSEAFGIANLIIYVREEFDICYMGL
jgi:hypothetical protein